MKRFSGNVVSRVAYSIAAVFFMLVVAAIIFAAPSVHAITVFDSAWVANSLGQVGSKITDIEYRDGYLYLLDVNGSKTSYADHLYRIHTTALTVDTVLWPANFGSSSYPEGLCWHYDDAILIADLVAGDPYVPGHIEHHLEGVNTLWASGLQNPLDLITLSDNTVVVADYGRYSGFVRQYAADGSSYSTLLSGGADYFAVALGPGGNVYASGIGHYVSGEYEIIRMTESDTTVFFSGVNARKMAFSPLDGDMYVAGDGYVVHLVDTTGDGIPDRPDTLAYEYRLWTIAFDQQGALYTANFTTLYKLVAREPVAPFCDGFEGAFCDDFETYLSTSDPEFQSTWLEDSWGGTGTVTLVPSVSGQAVSISIPNHEFKRIISVAQFPLKRTVECDAMNLDFGLSSDDRLWYGAWLAAYIDENSENAVAMHYRPCGGDFRITYAVNGGYPLGEYYTCGSGIVITTDQWYRMRIDIGDNTISYYYDVGAGYQLLCEHAHTLGQIDAPIRLSQGGFDAAEAHFDNVTVTVAAEQAPVITTTPPTEGEVCTPYTYDVDATGYPAPTYALTDPPEGMIIDPVSGLIEWTPQADDNYDVTVIASNGVVPDAQQDFTITVNPATEYIIEVRYDEDPGALLADKDVILVKIRFPSDTGIVLGTFRTSTSGEIAVPNSLLSPADLFRVEHQLDYAPHPRFSDPELDGMLFRVYIDNVDFDMENGYSPVYGQIDPCNNTVAILSHFFVSFNLRVAVQWNASTEFLGALENAIKHLSNYMYDVYDGQARLGKVAIYDNAWDSSFWGSDLWEYSDMLFHSTNAMEMIAQANFNLECRMPRMVYGPEERVNVELTEPSSFNLWDTDEVSFEGDTWYWPGVRAMAHELGHFLMDFVDEYGCDAEVNYGLMDGSDEDLYQLFRNQPKSSEMSNESDYDDPTLSCIRLSCWERFENLYEKGDRKATSDVPYDILRPGERGITGDFEGPNNDLNQTDYEVGFGGHVRIIPHYTDTGGAPFQVIATKNNGQEIVGGVSVDLLKGVDEYRISQGKTADNGKIWVLGAGCGDVVRTTVSQKSWIFLGLRPVVIERAEIEVCPSPSLSDQGLLASADVINLDLQPVAANLSFLPSQILTSSSEALLDFYLVDSSFEIQNVRYQVTNGIVGDFAPTVVENQYSVLVSPVGAYRGDLTLDCVDSLSQPFSFLLNYDVSQPLDGKWYPMQSEYIVVALDTAETAVTKVAILSSPFGNKWGTISDDYFRVGHVWSVDVYPGTAAPLPAATVFCYEDDSLSQSQEQTLEAYRWDTGQSDWFSIPSIVDTSLNRVTVDAAEDGTYALFGLVAGCCQHRGDLDHNGAVLPTDAAYFVNWLWRSGPGPLCMDEADVNGDDSVDPQDCIYFVNYMWKGGPAPVPCE